MKYEIILFDADDTLFDFKRSEQDAFKNTMLEFNIDYKEDYHLNIYQNINTTIWKEFEDKLITQEKLKVERFKRLSDHLKAKFNEEKFAKSYMKHLADASFLYEDTIPLIKNLHQHCKLAIVTNGLTDVQDKRIRKSIIAEYFQAIVISEEIGVSKPDPEIFKYTFDNIEHWEKSKILMVGDSLTSDIQGGINFGIHTCWYNPRKFHNRSEIRPTYEITNLMELICIVES